MDYDVNNTMVSGTGLLEPPTSGHGLVWDPDHKQGIHILKKPVDVVMGAQLKYKVQFNATNGDVSFAFNV